MIIYHNGAFLPLDTVSVSPLDRGFFLGDGVFDTLLAVDGQCLAIEDHYKRLHDNAAVFGMSVPFSNSEFPGLIQKLLKDNNALGGRYSVRTVISRGVGPRGLMPPENADTACFISISPVADPSTLPPVHALISETVRRNELSPLSRVKSLNYGDNVLAMMEAREKGCNEAILLNTCGSVACATTSNIYIVENGQWYTPPLTDGVLDGIMRQTIIKAFDVTENTISKDRLEQAQSIYLSNSVIGIRGIEKLNDRFPDISIDIVQSPEKILALISK